MDSLFRLVNKNVFSTPIFKPVNCKFNNEPCKEKCEHQNRLPVPSRRIACAATDEYSTEFGSTPFFLLCGLGGALCCAFTHVVTLPLDMVKCRMQVDSVKYPTLLKGTQVTVREDGFRGLIKGWSPTLIGYSAQGACKYGLYEVFKIQFSNMVGPSNAYHYRTGVYLAAAFSAEAIADVFLSPFEVLKVRIQTQPEFVSTMRQAVPIIMAKEGISGFYKTLVPLWARQIPYTVVKFVCFERCIEMLYKHVVPKPRDQITKSEQLAVTFTAGYIAGIFCAIASHPPDTLVSKLQEKGSTVSSVYAKIGMRGLWAGLGPRILMIGTIAATQWFIYDGFKVAMRMPRPPPPTAPPSER